MIEKVPFNLAEVRVFAEKVCLHYTASRVSVAGIDAIDLKKVQYAEF